MKSFIVVLLFVLFTSPVFAEITVNGNTVSGNIGGSVTVPAHNDTPSKEVHVEEKVAENTSATIAQPIATPAPEQPVARTQSITIQQAIAITATPTVTPTLAPTAIPTNMPTPTPQVINDGGHTYKTLNFWQVITEPFVKIFSLIFNSH